MTQSVPTKDSILSIATRELEAKLVQLDTKVDEVAARLGLVLALDSPGEKVESTDTPKRANSPLTIRLIDSSKHIQIIIDKLEDLEERLET